LDYDSRSEIKVLKPEHAERQIYIFFKQSFQNVFRYSKPVDEERTLLSLPNQQLLFRPPF
jgi:hypothetical protein